MAKNTFEEIREIVKQNYINNLRKSEREKRLKEREEAENRQLVPLLDEDCVMDFDGENLDMYRGNELQYRVPVSAMQPEVQGSEDFVNAHPIPEGMYHTDNMGPGLFFKQLDRYNTTDFSDGMPRYNSYVQRINNADKVLDTVGLGTWPGGAAAWGKSRVRLIPEENTETVPNPVYIHGGPTADQNGIGIDQYTPVMEAFTGLCQPNIPVRVRYPR